MLTSYQGHDMSDTTPSGSGEAFHKGFLPLFWRQRCLTTRPSDARLITVDPDMQACRQYVLSTSLSICLTPFSKRNKKFNVTLSTTLHQLVQEYLSHPRLGWPPYGETAAEPQPMSSTRFAKT